MKPGSPEWHKRVATVQTEESIQPEGWWYLSFAHDDGFRGAAIVRGRGVLSAVQEAHRLEINPGGQVMSIELGDDPGPLPVNRLLSKEDLGPDAKTVGELEAEGVGPGLRVEFSE